MQPRSLEVQQDFTYPMDWSFYLFPPWMMKVLSPPDTITAVCTRCFSFPKLYPNCSWSSSCLNPAGWAPPFH